MFGFRRIAHVFLFWRVDARIPAFTRAVPAVRHIQVGERCRLAGRYDLAKQGARRRADVPALLKRISDQDKRGSRLRRVTGKARILAVGTWIAAIVHIRQPVARALSFAWPPPSLPGIAGAGAIRRIASPGI